MAWATIAVERLSASLLLAHMDGLNESTELRWAALAFGSRALGRD